MASRWTVGVDFGGTNIKLGLVNGQGRVAHRCVLSAKAMSRPSQFVEGIGEAIESLARRAGTRTSHLRGVGVGAPGSVETRRGVVRSLVNVPGWRDVPLRRWLERRLRCRCAVDNDANLCALGEWRFGAGRGARALVGVTLGTGVGGGLVLGGRLYQGAAGAAGEIGHMVIAPRGRRCACGRRGCLEAYVGTAAILAMGARAMRRGAEPLRTLVREAGGRLTPALISEAARRGDAEARTMWAEVGCSLGIGLANVVNLLNPDRIVIGGGVANAWPFFAPALMRTVRREPMDIPAQAVRIVRAQLGDRAGILGAAMLVWDEEGARGERRGAGA